MGGGLGGLLPGGGGGGRGSWRPETHGVAPEGTLGYVTCALAANSTKRRKKMGSSVAYKTIGTFLLQNKRHEDACGGVAPPRALALACDLTCKITQCKSVAVSRDLRTMLWGSPTGVCAITLLCPQKWPKNGQPPKTTEKRRFKGNTALHSPAPLPTPLPSSACPCTSPVHPRDHSTCA